MVITLIGCAIKSEEFALPFGKLYSLRFKVDYDAFESGQYIYGHTDYPPRSIGSGGVIGLEQFHDLRLDFKLKDGRTIKRNIDVKSAVDSLVAKGGLNALIKSNTGVSSTIVVDIKSDAIILNYDVNIDSTPHDGSPYFRTTSYPLLRIEH